MSVDLLPLCSLIEVVPGAKASEDGSTRDRAATDGGARMTTIMEFLEARLAEDEFGATHSGKLPVPEASYHQRTLREVAAKRSILRRYRDAPISDAAVLLKDIRDLASVYNDHQDYDKAGQPLKDATEIDLPRPTEPLTMERTPASPC
jgi:hypothetical protein